MNTIQPQLDFFNSHEKELCSNYKGSVIIIGPDMTVHSFSSPQEGYINGVNLFGYGVFLLKDLRYGVARSVNMINPTITTTL